MEVTFTMNGNNEQIFATVLCENLKMSQLRRYLAIKLEHAITKNMASIMEIST